MRAAAGPDAFVDALAGWQAPLVTMLRRQVHAGGAFEEGIKWGNLVFFANGPCILIRVEEARVLFSFWRGKRLTGIEPRIRPSGKYELGNWELHEGDSVDPAIAERLAREAAALNRALGDPTKEAR